MRLNNLFLFFLSFLALFIFSCRSDSSVNPPLPSMPNLAKLFQETIKNTNVQLTLWGPNRIETGYNKIYVTLEDLTTKKPIENAQLLLLPKMVMKVEDKEYQHGSPVEKFMLISTKPGTYSGGVVFTMPSDDLAAQWQLSLQLTIPNLLDMYHIAPFSVVVYPLKSAENNLIILETVNNRKLILAWVKEDRLQVGENIFACLVYEKKSPWIYEGINNIQMTVEPRMPLMDNHSSPGNRNPVLKGNGYYGDGLINFTMTGLWYLCLDIKQEGKSILKQQVHFSITL